MHGGDGGGDHQEDEAQVAAVGREQHEDVRCEHRRAHQQQPAVCCGRGAADGRGEASGQEHQERHQPRDEVRPRPGRQYRAALDDADDAAQHEHADAGPHLDRPVRSMRPPS